MTTLQSKSLRVLATLILALSLPSPGICEGTSAAGTMADTAATVPIVAETPAGTTTTVPVDVTKCEGAAEESNVAAAGGADTAPAKEKRIELLECIENSKGSEKVAPIINKKGKKPVVALVLGGGGTRGAAHVGVLRVLEKENIKPDMVVGTSMGAIVGGFYCAGIPLDDIEKRFRDTSLMKHFMTVSIPTRILLSPVLLLPRLFVHPYDGLYAGTKFRKFLYSMLPEDEKKIEDLKLPFAAVAVNLLDGNVHALTEGSLAYAMQASSAVPGLRKPVEIGPYLFCDGAMIENVPVGQARRLGADIVIAVNVDEGFDPSEKAHFRKIGSVAKRIVDLQLYQMDRPLSEKADITIRPLVSGIGLVSCRREDAIKAIDAGTKATQEALPAIRKALQSQAGNI